MAPTKAVLPLIATEKPKLPCSVENLAISECRRTEGQISWFGYGNTVSKLTR